LGELIFLTVEEIFAAPIFLAPMAGVTDAAFRITVRNLSEKNLLMFSEMISCNGIHYRNTKTLEMLKTVEAERPIAIQLFGAEPDICAEAAEFVENSGNAAVIDFNVGCPAPKITKNGEGSALMKDLPLLGKILSAIRKSVTLPFSVKMRLGYDEINAVEVAKVAESCGVDFIAVHGRTRQQFYSGAANWEEIAKVKSDVKIPVIANGDVRDYDSLDKILQVTKADGVMVGRACQGNAWLIGNLLNYFLTGKKNSPPTLTERIKIMRLHFDKLIDFKGEDVAIREMRKHAAWYTKGLKGSASLRNNFNHVQTAKDFFKILSELEERIDENF